MKKIRILVGNKGNVDFEEPILMSPQQGDQFIKFMRTLFDVVIVEVGKDIREERLGDKLFFREWTSEELRLLLEVEDTEKVSERLGRSWMSVDIKRGEFIPEFMYWAHKKGYDIVQGDTKKLIEEFMAEKEQVKKANRAARKKARDTIKQLREKKEKLLKERDAINLRKRVGLKYADDDEHLAEINKELRDINKKLKQSNHDF